MISFLSFIKLVLLIIIIPSVLTSTSEENTLSPGCGELGDCVNSQDCDNICGCDPSAAVLFYNETIGECFVNVKKLLESLQEKYKIESKLRLEVVQVFKGVTAAIILFVTCASLCVFTACIYCIRINYMDNKMKNDVEALAAKLKRECRFKKSNKSPPQQKAESCNIIVEDAGVYVV